MLNNTIPDLGWQLDSQTYGDCRITPQALAGLVLALLRTFPHVTGVGTPTLPLHHPDAWHTIIITRIDAYEIPVAMTASAIRPAIIDHIRTSLTQQLSQWVGMPVSITVAVVNTTPQQRKGTHRGAH